MRGSFLGLAFIAAFSVPLHARSPGTVVDFPVAYPKRALRDDGRLSSGTKGLHTRDHVQRQGRQSALGHRSELRRGRAGDGVGRDDLPSDAGGQRTAWNRVRWQRPALGYVRALRTDRAARRERKARPDIGRPPRLSELSRRSEDQHDTPLHRKPFAGSPASISGGRSGRSP
jgi:hypothetical protein